MVTFQPFLFVYYGNIHFNEAATRREKISAARIRGTRRMGNGVFLCFALLLLVLSENYSTVNGNKLIGSVGGVVDCTSRVGKEEKIAMKMAIEDFSELTGYELDLVLKDIGGNGINSALAASAAMTLIKNQEVEAVVGSLTSHEVTLVAAAYNITSEVPIISLVSPATTLLLVPAQGVPVVYMSHSISMHMNCIAAIVGSFRWRQVIALYEYRNPFLSDLGLVTLLSDALRDVGTNIEHYIAFPPLSSLSDPRSTIQELLKETSTKRSTVFIVLHSSLPLTTLLFEQAKQLGLMGKGHVWIIDDGITSLLDALNSSVITSMEGVLGFKTYISESTSTFREFKVRFRRKFRSEFPEEKEENPNPSVFALRAYDATWAIAKAFERSQEKRNSRTLLLNILSSNFTGVNSEIYFRNYELAHKLTFQIVNVVGKSYRVMGFWSPEIGFSQIFNSEEGINVPANEVFDLVYWPGGQMSRPLGLQGNLLNGSDKPLQIAAPVTYQKINALAGFSIDVFNAAVNHLNYKLLYELIPFYGSYDEMVDNVSEKVYDGAIGDMVLTVDRCQLIECSQPYTGGGLMMVVKMKADKSQGPFMFTKPFTWSMWFMMAAMTLFNGFVVWHHEHRVNEDFRGSPKKQISKVFWFSS